MNCPWCGRERDIPFAPHLCDPAEVRRFTLESAATLCDSIVRHRPSAAYQSGAAECAWEIRQSAKLGPR
jgi:hypothetical protein